MSHHCLRRIPQNKIVYQIVESQLCLCVCVCVLEFSDRLKLCLLFCTFVPPTMEVIIFLCLIWLSIDSLTLATKPYFNSLMPHSTKTLDAWRLSRKPWHLWAALRLEIWCAQQIPPARACFLTPFWQRSERMKSGALGDTWIPWIHNMDSPGREIAMGLFVAASQVLGKSKVFAKQPIMIRLDKARDMAVSTCSHRSPNPDTVFVTRRFSCRDWTASFFWCFWDAGFAHLGGEVFQAGWNLNHVRSTFVSERYAIDIQRMWRGYRHASPTWDTPPPVFASHMAVSDWCFWFFVVYMSTNVYIESPDCTWRSIYESITPLCCRTRKMLATCKVAIALRSFFFSFWCLHSSSRALLKCVIIFWKPLTIFLWLPTWPGQLFFCPRSLINSSLGAPRMISTKLPAGDESADCPCLRYIGTPHVASNRWTEMVEKLLRVCAKHFLCIKINHYLPYCLCLRVYHSHVYIGWLCNNNVGITCHLGI